MEHKSKTPRKISSQDVYFQSKLGSRVLKRKVVILFAFQINPNYKRTIYSPRPFYPFSYVWSKEYAATKIQAGVRGYWVRRTEAVQEMRQFWKVLPQLAYTYTIIAYKSSFVLKYIPLFTFKFLCTHVTYLDHTHRHTYTTHMNT